MHNLIKYLILILFTAGCSTTSWVVVSEDDIDRDDYELLDSDIYLDVTKDISPASPGLTFTLRSVNTYEYTQRIRSERYIQRYRPRAGYLALGLTAASLSVYAAFSDQLIREPANLQKATLISTGALLTGISFLNMKAVGDPTPTGETKLLRRSGSVIQKDTTVARPYLTTDPEVRITYQGELLVNETSREFRNNQIYVNLAEELDPDRFESDPSDPIIMVATYGEDTTRVEIPVSSVFEKFVIVENSVTPLRNEPEINESNVLAELAMGSQLEFVSYDSSWVKVLYGISETYVDASDISMVWRPSEFAAQLSVITVPNVPFGSVDVERNLPVIRPGRSTAHKGIIIANSQYQNMPERIYGERDARLMKEIFSLSLNITDDDIIQRPDITSKTGFSDLKEELLESIMIRDSVLVLYLSGYATVQDGSLFMLGAEHKSDDPDLIDLNALLEALSKTRIEEIQVIADLDILSEESDTEVFDQLSSTLRQNTGSAVLLFSSETGQRSGWYSSSAGEQNRHSIFTYYFADALKRGFTRYDDIFRHLERNVPFISRSIYDRPQNVVIFGNDTIDLSD